MMMGKTRLTSPIATPGAISDKRNYKRPLDNLHSLQHDINLTYAEKATR